MLFTTSTKQCYSQQLYTRKHIPLPNDCYYFPSKNKLMIFLGRVFFCCCLFTCDNRIHNCEHRVYANKPLRTIKVSLIKHSVYASGIPKIPREHILMDTVVVRLSCQRTVYANMNLTEHKSFWVTAALIAKRIS